MAAKLRQPGQQAIVASAAAIALAGLLAAPVFAAPERGLLCDASADPSITVTPGALTATPVNNSDDLLEDHLLRPRTKAAVRGAFPEDAPVDEGKIDTAEGDASEAALPEPGAHSTTQQKRPVYKRQMYRRDI